MANYVKYSTNAQTRALKMGNFWLGTANDGKGPTSSTGYYTAKNPPSGGFTIYTNKTSNGPSIFEASNESQLVSITNQLGGTSFTTSAQCLTWYVTQTDKFCVNREYEGIITNGLIFNLDAGFTPSYPTSGTSWYDLGPSGYTGTLINGPTFTPLSGGSIVFDGTNDYVNIATPPSLSNVTSFSYSAFVVCVPEDTGAGFFSYGSLYNWSNDILLGYYNNIGSIYFQINNGADGGGRYSYIPPNGFFNVTLVYNGNESTNDTRMKAYINAVQIPLTFDYTVPSVTSTQTNPLCFVGAYSSIGGASDWCLNGKIGNTLIYNRALTPTEVLQNYNVQKGRFGL